MSTFAHRPVRLHRVTDIDEMRTVSVASGEDGALMIIEQTDGELTYQTFGTPSHAHMVRIEEASLGALCSTLGSSELDDALQRFFSDDGVFLSDLLDCMDQAGISYSYATSTDAATVIRMHADEDKS